MIVWQGLIGKMVGFLATKLLGKKIVLLLDDRKKAARAFVKLYNAITELEQVTSLLINELNDIKKGKSKFITGRSLSFISKAIDVQSLHLVIVESTLPFRGLYLKIFHYLIAACRRFPVKTDA
jgi:DNA-binding Xre family transcriptional regulator